MRRRNYDEKVEALIYIGKAVAYVFAKVNCNESTEFVPDPGKYEWFMNALYSIRNCINYYFNSKESSEPVRTVQRIIEIYESFERAVNCQGTTDGFYANENSGSLYFEYMKLLNSL